MIPLFIQYVAISALCLVVMIVAVIWFLIKFKMEPVNHIVGSFHQIFHAAYFYRSKVVQLAGFHLFGNADKLLKKTIDDCVQVIIKKTKETEKFHIDEVAPETIRLLFDSMTTRIDREYIDYFRLSLGKAYANFMNDEIYRPLAEGLDSLHRNEEELLRAYEYFSTLLHIGVANHVEFTIMRLHQISAGMYNLKVLKCVLKNSDENPGQIDMAQVMPMLKFPPNMYLDKTTIGIFKDGSLALQEVLDRALTKA